VKEVKEKYILMAVYNPIQYDARVIRAAEALNKMGESIVVISSNSNPGYSNRHFKSLIFKSDLKGLFGLFLFWLHIFKFSLANLNSIKLLYIHDYNLVYLGRLISSLCNFKWVYDAHELVMESSKVRQSIKEKVFFLMEKWSIKKADLVITANEERKRIIKSVYKVKNIISVLNISKLNYTIETGSKKNNIIVYQGYISETRQVSNFIRMLSYLPNDVKLKLIGDGPDLRKCQKLVRDENLECRVKFTGMVPYSKLLAENEESKVGIVVYKLQGINNYYCSPNKIFEYAQLGIPMLLSSQPFLKKVNAKYKIGEIICPDDTNEDMARKILKLLSNLESYKINMERFLEDYSFEKEMNKLTTSVKVLISP
jgi:glycosyltransferase involved in cell wall biosynthesis